MNSQPLFLDHSKPRCLDVRQDAVLANCAQLPNPSHCPFEKVLQKQICKIYVLYFECRNLKKQILIVSDRASNKLERPSGSPVLIEKSSQSPYYHQSFEVSVDFVTI